MKKEENQINEKIKEESAGKLMITEVPVVNEKLSIKEIKELINKEINNLKTINYIYVINNSGKLVGVLSIKDIFRLQEKTTAKQAINRELITARIHTDQEKVALLALKNNIKAIPIVDKENNFLGVVSQKTILDILHKEGIEDVLHSAGIRKFKDPAIDIITASTKTHFKKRLPWLILGLFGGILAALIVRKFELMLDKYIILASFIPAIVYMADAVGTQSQTIFIRSMSLDKKLNFKSYIFREFKVNLLLGLVLGTIFYLVINLFWKINIFAFIIGFSIFLTVIIAMIISMILPFLFEKLKFDPAISSGPFATAIRDLTSLLVYFTTASLLMKYFMIT